MTSQPLEPASTAPSGRTGSVPLQSVAAPIDRRLAETLLAYRQAHGLTVRAAGQRAGASHWVWGQWEAGVVPNPRYLHRLADLLSLDPADVRRLAGPDRVRRTVSTGEAGSTPLSVARFAAGLTASELARRVHVSLASISRWEAGERSPGRHHWPRLATALGISVEDVERCFIDQPARSDVAVTTGMSALRRRRGLTQGALARAVGVDVSTVQRWEHSGRAPRVRALTVADVLAVDLSELGRPRLVTTSPTTPPSALRRLRRASHLPVSVVSHRVGVSNAALRAWERGTNQPSWTHARSLAAALGVPVKEVFEAAGIETPAHLDPRSWSRDRLPAILSELRRWQGLTQEDLAVLVDVSTATVGAWEAGRQLPRRSTVRQLDDVLGVTPRLSRL